VGWKQIYDTPRTAQIDATCQPGKLWPLWCGEPPQYGPPHGQIDLVLNNQDVGNIKNFATQTSIGNNTSEIILSFTLSSPGPIGLIVLDDIYGGNTGEAIWTLYIGGDLPVPATPVPTVAGDGFRSIADLFALLMAYFGGIASQVAGVPVIGEYFATPFNWISSTFGNIAAAFQSVGSWGDSVITGTGQAASNILGEIESKYPILTATPDTVLSWVRSSLESAYPLLTSSGDAIFNLVRPSLEGTFSILGETKESLLAYIKEQIEAAYEGATLNSFQIFGSIKALCMATWEILTYTPETLWQWLKNAHLDAWAESRFSDMQSVVLGWIESQMGYLITQAFIFLGHNWDSIEHLFVWLCEKLIDLMIRMAERFAGQLFALFEAVLRNIEIKD